MAQQTKVTSELARIILPIVILGAAAGGFVLLKSLKESPAVASPENAIVSVETVPVVEHRGPITIEVTGEVVPYREVNVSAEVSGRVLRKEPVCETGMFVSKGDVLFKIDAQDYDLEKRRLEKELEQSKAYLTELDEEIEGTLERIQVADQEVASAEGEWQRQLKLKGIVSDSQIDKANREYLAAKNARIQVGNQLRLLRTRASRLKSATELVEVQLERAELDIDRTTVKSPVAGVITGEHVQEDDYVQKGSTLVTIEDTSQAEITCHLDAEDEQWIWLSHPELLNERNDADEAWRDYQLPPTRARVIYRRGKLEYAWDGVLTRYDGLGFDPKTRTIPCRVVVDDPRREQVRGEVAEEDLKVGPRALVRGMHVTVELITDPKIPLLRVPAKAVQPGNTLWTVVTVSDSEGKSQTVLKRRTVQTVSQLEIEQSDGQEKEKISVVYLPDRSLTASDVVVTSPMSTPRDGMPVRLEESSP